MKIELRKRSPQRGYPGVQFIGVVTDDNGMRGNLIINPDGEYAMVINGHGHKLDQGAVAQAMAEVLSAKPGPKPGTRSNNPAGRPLDPYGRKAMYPVSLAPFDVETARDILGGGNTSQGVRQAVRFAAAHLDQFNQWESDHAAAE